MTLPQDTKLFLPVPVGSCIISQDWQGHYNKAIRMGCSPVPSSTAVCYYYPGIDYAGPQGTPIYATMDGDVIRAGPDSGGVNVGYGNHVRIQHAGGILSLYGHMPVGGVLVVAGQKVKAGHKIGVIGNTGNSTGPHLHFEVRDSTGIACDPAPFIVTEVPGPPPVQPPPVQPPPGFEIKDIPDLPKVAIITTIPLNVRTEPRVSAPRVGFQLYPGDVVDVMAIVITAPDTVWLKIGHKEYIAAVYYGKNYAQWV